MHLQAPDLQGRDEVLLAINPDMVNLVFYRMWQKGVLDVKIDQAFVDKKKAEIGLRAGLLGSIPQQRGIDPETPIVIDVSPGLWPFLDTTQKDPVFTVAPVILHVKTGQGNKIMDAALSLIVGIEPDLQNEMLSLKLPAFDVKFMILNKDLHASGEYDGLVKVFFDGIGGTLGSLLRYMTVPGLQKLLGDTGRLRARIEDGFLMISVEWKEEQ